MPNNALHRTGPLPRLFLALLLLGPFMSIPTYADETARIYVNAAGDITLNGKAASLAQVKDELTRLKQVGGTVEYSRADPKADPHPVAMEVIDAVADAGLPIRMPQLGGQ